MAKDDVMEFEGVVESSCKDKFVVKVREDYKVICTLSGKLRQSQIKILNGDTTKIEVSIYNPKMGRIVYRIK